MKVCLALLLMLAVNGALATQKTVKSFKNSAHAKMSVRLQSLHKSARSTSTHLLKPMRHKNPIDGFYGKPNPISKRQISCKVIKEEMITIQEQHGFYFSVMSQFDSKQIYTWYRKEITDTERMTLITTDCGKVALYNPLSNLYITPYKGPGNNAVQMSPVLTNDDLLFLTTEPQDQDQPPGTVRISTQDAKYLSSYGTKFKVYFYFTPNYPPFSLASPGGEFLRISGLPQRTIIKEETVLLKSKQGCYISVQDGKVVGSAKAGDSERLTIVTLESGMVAIRTPDGKGYLTPAYVNDWLHVSSSYIDISPNIEGLQLWDRNTDPDGSVKFFSVFKNYLRVDWFDGRCNFRLDDIKDENHKFNAEDPKPAISYPHALIKEEIIALKTADGSYLTVRSQAGAEVISLSSQLGQNEKLTLLRFDNGKVALRVEGGKYLRVQPGSEDAKVDVIGQVDDDATFDLFLNPDNSATLRSIHNTYLRADSVGAVSHIHAETLVGRSGLFFLIDPSKLDNQQQSASSGF